MSTQLSQTERNTPDEEGGDGLSAFDVVSELITGPTLPAPIRRNLYKTLGRLCSSFVDIPVAYFEGKADEIRAGTRARIQLIETATEQIAHQMRVDPEYVRIAAAKYGQKVLREQVNLDRISKIAAIELRNHGALEDQTTADEVDDDWTDNFESEARKKSTEEMQLYFGRVLAGEIKKPKSFSLKSIKVLGEMDQNTANLFRKLCSVCVQINVDGYFSDMRVLSLGGNAANNSLAKYGLSFGELNVLNEQGLIIPDYNSWRDYGICKGSPAVGQEKGSTIKAVRAPFLHQGKYWVLEPRGELRLDAKLQLHGVALTRSGMELSKVVQTDSVQEFAQDLIVFFRGKQFDMTEVLNEKPQILDAHGWRQQ